MVLKVPTSSAPGPLRKSSPVEQIGRRSAAQTFGHDIHASLHGAAHERFDHLGQREHEAQFSQLFILIKSKKNLIYFYDMFDKIITELLSAENKKSGEE